MPAWRMRRADSQWPGDDGERAGGRASAAVTLATSFATTSAATNDAIRLSDVYSFSGTGADIFVLELSMTSVATGSYLAWLDTATNQWVNAVEGNTGNNATAAQQGFAGSFAAFQSIYGTQLDSYLGLWHGCVIGQRVA